MEKMIDIDKNQSIIYDTPYFHKRTQLSTKLSFDNFADNLLETIDLKLLVSNFINNKIELLLNGFILNFSNHDYIISIHHNLPIDNIYEGTNSLNILINSCWSETLILDNNLLDLSKYKINKYYQNKLPKPNDILELKKSEFDIKINQSATMVYKLKVINYDFHPFDNIQSDYLIPYITVIFCNDNIDNIIGLSGAPIFINHKLVGIFSKYNCVTKIGYILPIYIIIKNLIKNNNNNIYTITEDYDNIIKINSYNIKSNYVYNSSLKINIPLTTYILIEGDENKYVNIRYKNKFQDIVDNTVIYLPTNKLDISNESSLITMNISNIINYKLNSRLLSLILKLNKQLVLSLISKIIQNKTILWLKFNNDNKLIVFKNDSK